jgi:hypothetical protein
MYHPATPTDVEYVELLNISAAPVMLFDATEKESWQFTDNPDEPTIEFLFPAAEPVTLGPGEYAVLTRDPSLLASRYSIPPGVKVWAWGAGRLSDDGTKLRLSKPGDLDADGVRRWIRVDQVAYSDGAHAADFPQGVDPWPSKADGQGLSLARVAPADYGNDPSNWRALTPSPGRANP